MNVPLSALIWFPAIGALLLQLLGFVKKEKDIKSIAVLFTTVALGLNLAVLSKSNSGTYLFQAVESVSWIENLGIRYLVGYDGISFWLTVLTTLMTLIIVVATPDTTKNLRGFFGLVLLLETAMLGSFCALDLVLFFSFFELTLIPMFFLVSLWGGPNRNKAAAKFVIYTFAGSIFMLVGIVALAIQHQKVTGQLDFSIINIQASVASGKFWANALQAQTFIFWALALGFMVKTPAFPFHSWIGDTYAESPTAGPILSSVMVKMGSYGFLRFCLPLFPEAVQSQAPVFMAIATIGILYGALVAIAQTDMRRMIAYSSLSHMGFVLLGIFSLSYKGMIGGSFQQFSHGITTGLLVILVGYLVEKHGTADMNAFGGLKAKMPLFAGLFLLGMLGSVGLPTTNGFIGEFLALMGAYETGARGLFGLSPGFAIASGLGVVLGAVYLFVMFQKVFYGPVKVTEGPDWQDIPVSKALPAFVLVFFVFVGGLYPNLFFGPMEASTQATRLMAISEATKRPSWKDKPEEVTIRVALEDPMQGQYIRAGSERLISSARLHGNVDEKREIP